MEITPRQYGRLEMAAWALAKHSEHNEVCTVLSNGIMEVLDEIAADDDLDELHRKKPDWQNDTGRLPDIPDWRDGAARQAENDDLVQIRLIVAEHQGESMAAIIEAIQKGIGINSKELAAVLGVNPGRISEAKKGHPKPCFIARFTEVLGEGGVK